MTLSAAVERLDPLDETPAEFASRPNDRAAVAGPAGGVELICKVLPIAPSTYHAHVAGRRDPALLSDRARRDGVLKKEIHRVFKDNYAVYGVRKVWRQMKREGFDVSIGVETGPPIGVQKGPLF